MRTKAKHIATGGIFAGLTVVLCLVGSLSVGSRMLIAAICGILLLLLRWYVSGKLALSVYLVSSVLLLLLSDRLTAVAYIMLFGYYPILSDAIRKIPFVIRFLLKLLLLAAVGLLCLFGGATMMGLWENPAFREAYPMMVGLYCIMTFSYDLFLTLLRLQVQNRWDTRLRKLFR